MKKKTQALAGVLLCLTACQTATPSPTPTPVPTATLAPSPVPTLAPTQLAPTAIPLPAQPPTSDGAPLVYVPAGPFTMGSDMAPNEKPVHTVTLDAFWIDQFEVTNAQYQQCVATRACAAPPDGYSGRHPDGYYNNPAFANFPVASVTWTEANQYCLWAGGRLPSEAEWEKAARGTDARLFPWGNTFDPARANSALNVTLVTTAAGTYPTGASPYGAQDMAGNVWEWVADWYGENYYAQSPDHNPLGPAIGQTRIVRGGGYGGYDTVLRTTERRDLPADQRNAFVGFRCLQPALPTLAPLPSDPQTVTFKTASGITLTGVYYPAATNPAALVVLMHGSGGHYQDWIANGMVQWLQNRGRHENASYPPVDDPTSFAPMPAEESFAVFAFNNSAGDTMEGTHAAILAAQALPGVDPHRLVTMGGSFGADAATEACTLPGCVGVLGFSPIGAIGRNTYAQLVTQLGAQGKVAWCIKAQGDAHGCPPAQGELFRAILDPGVAHSLGLLFNKQHAQNWLYTLDFLDCAFERKC